MRLITLLLALMTVAWGQPALTTISETLYGPDGSPANGTVDISLNATCFGPPSSTFVFGGKLPTITVTSGVFSVGLAPNSTCSPSSTNYKVEMEFSLSGGKKHKRTEYWRVPSGSGVRIRDIQMAGPSSPGANVPISSLTASCLVQGVLSWNGNNFTCDSTILNNPMTTLGDMVYGASSGSPARVSGNTSTTRKFLSQTGDGSASAAPSWLALLAADIPALDASKVTTGTLDDARISQSSITQHQAALAIAASQVTSGQLALARGGTAADLSASGGAGHILKQSSTGAPISVGALVASDIPSLDTSKISTGTFADARVAASNVTQHQAALALATSQITSGTFADARIAASNITQHQAALSLAASQIASGQLALARGGTGADLSATGGSGYVLKQSSVGAGVTVAALVSSDLPTTITGLTSVTSTAFVGALTGNASTATALAANPTDCSANQFATAIAASGNLTCAQPAAANLSDGTTGTGAVVLATSPTFVTGLTTPLVTYAGTLALSATGANVITLSTNGSERFRINSAGTMSLINGAANPVFQMSDSLAGATRKEFTITVDNTNNRVELQAIQQGVAVRPIAINPAGGSLLVGTTTDAGSSHRLQVAQADDVSVLIKSTSTAIKAAYTVYERSTTGAARAYWLGAGINSTADFTLYDATNSKFRWSVTPAGNTLIGGAAEGNYMLDVQSSGSAGTARFYDQKDTTGVTRARFTPGAAQSTVPLIAATSGSNLSFGVGDTESFRIGSTGQLQIYPNGSGSNLLLKRYNSGSGNGQLWAIGIDNAAADDTFTIGYSSSTYTTGGILGWIGNSSAFMYYPVTLKIGTGVGATPTATFTNGGNVLIGTTTDDTYSKLQVAGNIGLAHADAYNANIHHNAYYASGWKYVNSGYASGIYFNNSANGHVSIWTGANNSSGAGAALTPNVRLHVTNGGNVIIGTTTDDGARKLQVNGDLRIGFGNSIYSVAATDTRKPILTAAFNAGANKDRLTIQAPLITGDGVYGDIDFKVGYYSSPTTAMLLNWNGNVLIGTTTDDGSSKLQVNGTISVGAVNATGAIATSANSITVGAASASSEQGGNIRFRDDTGTTRWLAGHSGAAGATSFIIYDFANGKIPFLIEANAPTNAFIVKANGNLLVNTSTDDGSSSKLQVAGKISGTTTTADNTIATLANYSATGYGMLLIGGSATRYSFKVKNYSDNELFTINGDGTATLYNATAPTGVTSLVVKAGAGQGSSILTTWQNNEGAAIAQVLSTGDIWAPALAALGVAGSENAISIRKNASISASNVGYYFAHRDTGTDLWLYRFNGATYKNLLKFTYNGGTDQVQIAADAGMQLGFFGVTPVARAAALTAANNGTLNTGDATSDTIIGNMRTRIGELEAKLQAYGLLN